MCSFAGVGPLAAERSLSCRTAEHAHRSQGAPMPDMSGKNGLITAAGDGIGRASALAFARAGARVLLMDIAADGVEQTAQLVRDAGGVAEVMVGDASDEEIGRASCRERVKISATAGLLQRIKKGRHT